MTHDPTTNGSRKERNRPFPWRCLSCLKEEVYPQTIHHTAEVKHEGRLHRIDVPDLTIPKCRACGALVFDYDADDRVLQALRSQLKLLTPEEIKAGRKALGLKSKELAKRLGVADATVSRWEKKRLIQSRAMDNFLRVYFAVPEVRNVLRGEEQDAALGTTAIDCIERERVATDPGVRQREGRSSMDLDDIVARLNKHHQRASYGAVGRVLGRPAMGLMARRPKSHEDSWVVAAANNRRRRSRRGWPTDYTDDQIHPECLRQIRERLDDFIADEEGLRQWLNNH